MKFDFIIGNPPYQEETESESTRMPPIYNHFMDAVYGLANVVELITPARCLFDSGQTPKAWNKKMLEDPHLKVLHYEPDEKLSDLPEDDQELYRLYFIEERSQEEIAKMKGVSQNTISKKLRRIKKQLTEMCSRKAV